MTCSTSRAEFVPSDLKHSSVFSLFCLDWNAGFFVCRAYHHSSIIPQGLHSASTAPVASQHAPGTHLPLAWGQNLLNFQHDSFHFVCWEIFWLSWPTCVITVRWCHCGLQAERNIPHRWDAEGCDTCLVLSLVFFVKLEDTFSASALFAA